MSTKFDLPKRIMAEFPSNITDKILSGEELAESDKSIVRSYLDSIILHPESMAGGREQLMYLISFYMYVGARLNLHTVEAVKKLYGNDELNNLLDSYSNISPEVKIELKKNPIASSGFVNFCAMYADKGCKTHNFYAENFGKLLSSLERWVGMDAPYLMGNCEYVIYIDSLAVARVEKGKKLVPIISDSVMLFIGNTFGVPQEVDVFCNIREAQQSAFQIRSITIDGKVGLTGGEKEEMAVLPNSPALKVRLLREKVAGICQMLVKEYAFSESITSDIQTKVYINGDYIGEMGFGLGGGGFEEQLKNFAEEYFKYDAVESLSEGESGAESMSWYDKVLSYFK